jgi:hypothetical protein
MHIQGPRITFSVRGILSLQIGVTVGVILRLVLMDVSWTGLSGKVPRFFSEKIVTILKWHLIVTRK